MDEGRCEVPPTCVIGANEVSFSASISRETTSICYGLWAFQIRALSKNYEPEKEKKGDYCFLFLAITSAIEVAAARAIGNVSAENSGIVLTTMYSASYVVASMRLAPELPKMV